MERFHKLLSQPKAVHVASHNVGEIVIECVYCVQQLGEQPSFAGRAPYERSAYFWLELRGIIPEGTLKN